MAGVAAALVDVLPTRVAEILGGAVGRAPLAQRGPVADVREQRLAVAAATDAERTVPVQRAAAQRHVAVIEPLADDVLERRGGALLEADVDQPPASVAPPRQQRQHGAQRGVQAGAARRRCAGQGQWRRVRVAVRPHHAARGLSDQLVAGPGRARPDETERRHRDDHQSRPFTAPHDPVLRVAPDDGDVRARQRRGRYRRALDVRTQPGHHLDREAPVLIGRVEHAYPVHVEAP